MTTITEVIDVGVDHERSSKDGVSAEEADQLVLDFEVTGSVLGDGNISEVANMSLLPAGASVSLAMGIKVGSSSLAALGEVSKLMDVEAMKTWLKSGNVCGDFALLALNVDKLDKAIDARATVGVHDADAVECLWFHN